MSERVLVIGAGMAGLWTAMALAGGGREITLLDRDPPPPEGGADAAFDGWNRRGVGHLRHSHAFLARLRTLVRDRHPKLLDDLLAAGCRELGFEGSLTAKHKEAYRPAPIDSDLAILTSRRTTLELVMRRYVEQLPGVTIRSETFVKDLRITPGTPPTVTGVRLEDGTELTADLVVDAAGRPPQAPNQLAAAGAEIPESSEACGVIYFTRHYRLEPGAEEPAAGGAVRACMFHGRRRRDVIAPRGGGLWTTPGGAGLGRTAGRPGGQAATVTGLSGLGDLLLTATGDLSRNRQVGLRLGRGENLEQILADLGQVAEGVLTARSGLELARTHQVEVPLIEETQRILQGEHSVAEAVRHLLARAPKTEM